MRSSSMSTILLATLAISALLTAYALTPALTSPPLTSPRSTSIGARGANALRQRPMDVPSAFSAGVLGASPERLWPPFSVPQWVYAVLVAHDVASLLAEFKLPNLTLPGVDVCSLPLENATLFFASSDDGAPERPYYHAEALGVFEGVPPEELQSLRTLMRPLTRPLTRRAWLILSFPATLDRDDVLRKVGQVSSAVSSGLGLDFELVWPEDIVPTGDRYLFVFRAYLSKPKRLLKNVVACLPDIGLCGFFKGGAKLLSAFYTTPTFVARWSGDGLETTWLFFMGLRDALVARPDGSFLFSLRHLLGCDRPMEAGPYGAALRLGFSLVSLLSYGPAEAARSLGNIYTRFVDLELEPGGEAEDLWAIVRYDLDMPVLSAHREMELGDYVLDAGEAGTVEVVLRNIGRSVAFDVEVVEVDEYFIEEVVATWPELGPGEEVVLSYEVGPFRSEGVKELREAFVRWKSKEGLAFLVHLNSLSVSVGREAPLLLLELLPQGPSVLKTGALAFNMTVLAKNVGRGGPVEADLYYMLAAPLLLKPPTSFGFNVFFNLTRTDAGFVEKVPINIKLEPGEEARCTLECYYWLPFPFYSSFRASATLGDGSTVIFSNEVIFTVLLDARGEIRIHDDSLWPSLMVNRGASAFVFGDGRGELWEVISISSIWSPYGIITSINFPLLNVTLSHELVEGLMLKGPEDAETNSTHVIVRPEIAETSPGILLIFRLVFEPSRSGIFTLPPAVVSFEYWGIRYIIEVEPCSVEVEELEGPPGEVLPYSPLTLALAGVATAITALLLVKARRAEKPVSP